MKTGTILVIAGLLFWIGLSACQSDINANKGVCTAEFRFIGLTVLGDSLTDFYTLRLATSDTLRRATGVESRTHVYIVLDDTYQDELANKQEAFRFIGKKGQTVVVREDFILAADHCHIRKVSGKSEVQL